MITKIKTMAIKRLLRHLCEKDGLDYAKIVSRHGAEFGNVLCKRYALLLARMGATVDVYRHKGTTATVIRW